MRDEVTALVLTFDEAPNIERALRQLTWTKRILIIDSFSSDNTIELAKSIAPNCEILQRRFDTFAGQCNFGLSQIGTEWVLSIDADYVLTPELVAEITVLRPTAAVAGYSAEFRYCIYGRRLRSTVYPPRTVLYRRAAATYRNEGHGHRVSINGRAERLRGIIEHDDRKPLSRWIRSQDRYAEVEASHLLRLSTAELSLQDKLRRKIFITSWVMPLYLLFARGLILDGWPGWYYVLQRTIAEMLVSLRLITERKKLDTA